MLDAIRRCLFGGARPIDRTMLIVEVWVLIFVCYEACVLFINRRREKRRIAEEESGLENLPPTVLDDFREFILGGPAPSDAAWEAVNRNNPEIVGRDFVGWFIVKEHKRSLKKWARKTRRNLK
jgi:hypothetical protein